MIIIEKQGSVLCTYDPDVKPNAKKKTPLRGEITDFSRKSRRRMLIYLNRCDFRATRTSFLTLTFKSIPTIEEATQAFRKFMKRLIRAFPELAAIWRKEFQQRGAAHYHILLVNLPYLGWKSILRTWRECTPDGGGSIHIKLLRTHKAIIGYVSKYIAKPSESGGTTLLDVSPYLPAREKKSVGRAWGWINQAGLPLAQASRFETDDEELAAYLWWAIRAETKGRCGTNDDIAILFASDCEKWFAWAMRHARGYTPLPAERGKICYNERNGVAA